MGTPRRNDGRPGGLGASPTGSERGLAHEGKATCRLNNSVAFQWRSLALSSHLHTLCRWILRPIDLWATSGLAAVGTILATGTGQRLGDLAAGTAVVETRTRTTLTDTLFAPLDDDYEPTFRGAQALTRDDVATARRVLRRLSEASPGAPSETVRALGDRTRQALLHKMDATTDLPPKRFLKTVLRDYNYYQRG